MNDLAKKLLVTAGIAAAASFAGRAYSRSCRRFEWAGLTVIVTGGSRGLGLCLARQLIDQGANVAICARTVSDLEEASAKLSERQPDAKKRIMHYVWLSRPGEFHPQPLREPDVNLSAHPAPITRTTREYAKFPVYK